MKRFLPLLAVATMFVSAPVFAADEQTVAADDSSMQSGQITIAEAPSAAAATGERVRFQLTDSQLEQLRGLKDKYFADNTTKKAQLAILKNQLRSQMTKENVDRAAVLSIQSQINAAQADLNNARISQMLDAQTVFTPEQRKLMHERMLRGGFRHHGGRGHGGRGGSCGGGGMHGFHGHGGPGGHGHGFGPGAKAEGEQTPSFGPGQQAELPDAPDTDGIEG
jgi:Spy/CpxP family protein refolding chaperone